MAGKSKAAKPTGKLIGYACKRGNTVGFAHQKRLLRRAGCWNVYGDKDCDGPCSQRELALMDVRPGDVLAIVDLSALAGTLLKLHDVLLQLQQDTVGLWILNHRGLPDGMAGGAEFGSLTVSTLLGIIEHNRAERRELTRQGVVAAREKGRIGGRPRVASAKLGAAQELMAEQRYTMAEIAEKVGIARASLYNAGLKASRRRGTEAVGKEKPPSGGG
jgi:DNA invertase Pin-like site-specific DNA recombinase